MTDPKVETAYQTVARNCGLRPTAFARLQAHPQAAAKIGSLARTSPEYQRHVVARLLAGDRRPFEAIAATLLVYDTVGFHEVTSRLHRVLGSVRQEVQYLDQQIAREQLPDRLPDRLLTLDLIAEHAGTLSRLLAGLEVQPGVPRNRAKSPAPARSQRKELPAKLHAASALGIIAKNVRNVTVLQPEHLPMAQEKKQALALTKAVRQLASAGQARARRAFGNADGSLRVRSRRQSTCRIITHQAPGVDVLVAVWLTERFLLQDESVEVLFVPRRRALGAYRSGDCLVAVGHTHDPAHRFFDAESSGLPDRAGPGTAELIWKHLRSSGSAVEHLESLISALCAGRPMNPQARSLADRAEITTEGLHATLRRLRSSAATEADVYRTARRWLDRT
jgi:hypothetical protein